MKTALQRSLPFLFLLALFHGRLLATPACPIITQNFANSANGATVDNSATGWYIDASKLSNPVYFAVKSNRFKAENIGAEGIWYSRVFSTAGYSSFQVAIKITAEGTQTSAEYVKVYYKIDGGAETLLDQRTGNFGTIDFTSAVLTGSNVQMIVKIYNYANGSSQTSKYYVEQYRVFKEAAPCSIGSIGVTTTATNNGVLTCARPSLTLSAATSASGTTTWSWTGPNSFTSTAQSPTVSAAGTYTVVGTNAAGSGSASFTVTADKTAPDLTATGGALACGASVTINASSSVSGVTYAWTGPNSFSSASQSPSVSAAGTYTVTVTNPSNGCTASQSVTVTAGSATSSTLWLEDFTGLANGTTVDNGATAWSISNPGSGTFSVQNNEFKASFSGANEGVWTSGVIDISGKTNVVISASLRSETASSSDLFENDDHLRVYYKLNGGAETIFFDDSAGLGSSTSGTATATATSPALSGSTLQIVVRARNSDPTERYFFDNVKVVGLAQAATVTPSVTGNITCTSQAQLSATISGGTATAWAWAGPNGFTSASQSPTVSAGGQYTVTATLSGGCTASAPITLTENKTAPDIQASGGTLACLPTVTLNAGSSVSGATYSWAGPGGFTSTSKNPVVNTVGTYTATVTNPANGCTASQAVAVSYPAASSIWFEDFTLSNGTNADNGATAWSITAPPSGSIFSVQGNQFEVSNTTTTGEGVWASAAIPITGKTNVSISAAIRSAVTNGGVMNTSGVYTDYLRFYYKLNGGAEVLFYQNLGPVNNHSLTNTPISIGGLSGTSLQIVARIRATGSDEFYFFDSVKVAASSIDTVNVTATAGGVLTCASTSVTLSGVSTTPGVTYSWTGPNGFSSTVQNPPVSTPGVYTLTVTSPSTGCSASDTANVTQNITSLAVTASAGSILTCKDSTTVLSGSATGTGLTYSWTGPGSFSSAVQNPTVKTAGIYTLTVTNPASGCTGTDTALVTQNKTVPVVTATAQGQLNCATPLVSLSGSFTPSSGVTFGWTGPNGYTSTTQNPSIAVPGIYTLTVTGTSNGCAGSDTALVALNSTPPGASASVSGSLNCRDTVVTLSGSSPTSGVGFSWSGPGGFTSTLQNPTVKAGGNYQLTVTNPANGCFSNASITVSQDTTHPAGITAAITSTYKALTCVNNVVFMEGTAPGTGYSYGWTLPSGTVIPANGTNGFSTGVYTYTVTNNTNNCAANVALTVVSDMTPPQNFTAQPVTTTLTCISPTGTITASTSTSGVAYAWTGPNGFTASTASITATAAGNYSVEATNPVNGCAITTTVVARANTTPPANVTASTVSGSNLLTCASSSQTLSGSSATAGTSYAWTGPNGFTANTATAPASTAGVYTLTATNPTNGCTSTSSVTLTQNKTVPTGVTASAASPAQITCTTTNVALTGSSNSTGANYSWTGPNGFTATTANTSAPSAGTYTLTVSDATSGCTATATTTVTLNNSLPTDVSAFVNDRLTCNVKSVQLHGSSSTTGAGYSWTGPGGYNSTAAISNTDKPGSYVFTVTNPGNGCSKSIPVTVSQNITPPQGVTAANDGPLTCTVGEVNLLGNSTSSNVDYEWDGPDGYLSFSQQDVTSEAGIYTLTVSDAATGCTATATTTVVNTCGAAPTRKTTGTSATGANGSEAQDAFSGGFEYKTWPNPFGSKAYVEFKSPAAAFVTVQVFNNNGVLEKRLFNDKAAAGHTYRVSLDDRLPAGIHYFVIRVDNHVYTQKMIAVQ